MQELIFEAHMQQNEQRIRAFLKTRFPTYDDAFGSDEDLGQVVDSLGFFEFVEFVEREFGVGVPTEDFTPQRFSSIETTLSFVSELQSR